MPDYKPMYLANVEGTYNVIEAAGHTSIHRIVYTSTVGTIGLPKEVDGEAVPSTENDVIEDEDFPNDYKKSKWEAELLALKFAREACPWSSSIQARPSARATSSPTGQIIVAYLNRELPRLSKRVTGCMCTTWLWAHPGR